MPATQKDLRDHLNDLWKTTVDQFDEIKDIIVRHSHIGRRRLDTAFLKRQRDRFFQDLGEAVFNQVEAGTLELNAEGNRVVERIREALKAIEAEESAIASMNQGGMPPTALPDEPTLETVALTPDGEPMVADEAEPAVTAPGEPLLAAEAALATPIGDETVDAARVASDKVDIGAGDRPKRRGRRPSRKL
ncbi:MAG: hypothetical protein JXR83_01375 [Deltaproteobacteria bacterium]|nr:hypothetical protein [Deltaproteobacteria bacterium]